MSITKLREKGLVRVRIQWDRRASRSRRRSSFSGLQQPVPKAGAITEPGSALIWSCRTQS